MVDPSDRTPDGVQRQRALAFAMMGLLGQVGCITVVIIVVALAAGLWLDERFSTRPLFTLVFILGSVPVSLYSMIRIALSGIGRLQRAAGALEERGEEAERGGESGTGP